MAAEKLLAEWFWADRWSGSSAFGLKIAARGLYREMLTQAWRRGARLPNDPDQIMRFTGVTLGEWKRSWPLVKRFWKVDGDWLVNETQQEVYSDALGRAERASQRGLRGAQAKLKQCSSDAQAFLEDKPPSPSPSPVIKNPLTPFQGGRRYLRADLKEAKRIRKMHFGRCQHEPECIGGIECEVLIAIEIAERRKAAAS